MPDVRPIGLTGSIAGGKSTVLRMLAELGLRTASSDAVAREVFEGEPVQAALRERLGLEGTVHPATLREAILRDPDLRRWTNRLMHARIGARMSALDAEVIEVPLLFEACLQGRYREVWVAACGEDERERRLRERYGAEADVKAYGRWQLGEKIKVALADVCLRTDRPSEDVLAMVVAQATRCFSDRIAHLG